MGYRITGIQYKASDFLWYFFLAFLLKPNGIPYINSALNRIYDYGMLLALTYLLLYSKLRFKKSTLLIGLLFVWLVIQSYLGGVQNIIMWRLFIQGVGIILFVDILITQPNVLIRAFFYNFELLIWINFICIILFPNGMYRLELNNNTNNWLLGYDNHWFTVFFAALMFSLLYMYYEGKSFRPILLIAIIHISTFYTMSGVIVFGVILFDIFICFRLYKKKFFNASFVWICAILANVIVVFYSSSSFVRFVIYNVLQKGDSTILSRVRIWTITFERILNNPVFGHGHPASAQRVLEYGTVHGVNAHNFLLEILYETGFIGMLLFGIMMFGFIKNTQAYASSFIAKMLQLCVLICLIAGAVDSMLEPRCIVFWAILALGLNVPSFNDKLAIRKKRSISISYLWRSEKFKSYRDGFI